MNQIIQADARRLPFETGSIDCIVTSPPYLRQRRYGGSDAELGTEATLAAYVTELAAVFDEIRRVLKPNGWAWLNIGDKGNNSGGAGGDWKAKSAGREDSRASAKKGGPGSFTDPAYLDQTFLDVPGAVVRELLLRGWRLRLPIVWDKGREAPESLRHVNRPRWAHEMIYLLTPCPRHRRKGDPRLKFYSSELTETGSVWHFPPGGNGPSHLAPFPDELAQRCILPTTLPGDRVLDPFAGSGTVPRVASELGRIGLGTDIYPPEH